MSRYAVVLAAGKGERLWPLTSTRPKPLLPLPGSTLLGRVLQGLRGLVDGVVLVAGPHDWMVRKYVEEVLKLGSLVRIAVQKEARGTADAVRVGVEALPRSTDEVLVIYGDLYFDLSLLAELAGCKPNVAVAVKHSSPWEYGVLLVEPPGRVVKVVEKPSEPLEGYVNAGIYLLKRCDVEELVYTVKLSERGEYEFTDVLHALARRGELKAYIYEGPWMDVGRPWNLLEAARLELELLLRAGQHIEGEVEPGAVLRGPVYVGPEAVVRTGTVVEGPAWIEGEVGPLSRIRPYSVLLKGSRVGSFTEVKGSVLMEHAKASHLNYVGDSIIGEHVNLGAGTVTANVRFDKATVKTTVKGRRVDTGMKKLGAVMGGYSQTGVNASLMPGVKVGAFSWVEAGITLYEDVEDCVFVRSKGGELVKVSLEGRVRCCVEKAPWEPA